MNRRGHPSSCHDPECKLSYREHLLTISFGSNALPSRHPETHATNIRERRWHRDMDAFRRLHKQGLTPPQIDGSRLRELKGENEYDVTRRPVKIDYNDPT